MVEISERIRSHLGIDSPATGVDANGEVAGNDNGNGNGLAGATVAGDRMTAADDEPISLDWPGVPLGGGGVAAAVPHGSTIRRYGWGSAATRGLPLLPA